MQHLTLVMELALADYLYPTCGEYTFWCVAAVEVLGPVAIFIALIIIYRSLAYDL